MFGKKFLVLFGVFALCLIPVIAIDVFGHGNPGVDRAPAIDFENRNVTVEARMSPSDMTVGDFSNAFLSLKFIDDDTEEIFKQVTYAVEIYKKGELLARKNFYAEEGHLTVDIRPNSSCGEIQLWKCVKYYGSVHPIAGALYTLGENNPVIEGPIFSSGGLYNIKASVIGADSVRSNLLDPLEFDLYVTIAQEYVFYITVPDSLIIKGDVSENQY